MVRALLASSLATIATSVLGCALWLDPPPSEAFHRNEMRALVVAIAHRARIPTPGFLIVPQTMNSFDWSSTATQALWELIETELIGNQGLEIDLDRVYVTGWSLGAIGIFSWASDAPDKITAGCPFAGSMYWLSLIHI